MSKPPLRETAFYLALKHRIPKGEMHAQSMTGLTFNGTLDKYFDGPKADMWCELKVWPTEAPRSGMINVGPHDNVKKQPRGCLSPPQLRWALRRWQHGKNAVVIVAVGRKALILDHPDQWTSDVPISGCISFEEAAAWIADYCGN